MDGYDVEFWTLLFTPHISSSLHCLLLTSDEVSELVDAGGAPGPARLGGGAGGVAHVVEDEGELARPRCTGRQWRLQWLLATRA